MDFNENTEVVFGNKNHYQTKYVHILRTQTTNTRCFGANNIGRGNCDHSPFFAVEGAGEGSTCYCKECMQWWLDNYTRLHRDTVEVINAGFVDELGPLEVI